MDKIKALILDLDGTLVNSLPDISWAMNTVLEKHGFPTFPADQYRFMVGKGMAQLLKNVTKDHALEPEQFSVMLEQYVSLYKSQPVGNSFLYPGIKELLMTLESHLKLAILSNKDQDITDLVVKGLLPDVHFTIIQGAQSGFPHKPDPTSLRHVLAELGVKGDQALYLGDTDVDMETAKRGGCVPCGALWGFRSQEELESCGAQKVFKTPLEFKDWSLEQLSKS